MGNLRTASRIGSALGLAALGLFLGLLTGAMAHKAHSESYAVSGMMLGGGLSAILCGMGAMATRGAARLVLIALTTFCLGLTIQGFRLILT